MNCNQYLRDNSRERELALIEQLLCLTDNVCWVFCISPGFISSSIQFTSVAQSCTTLCDPMDYSTPGPPCPSPTPRVYSNSCPLSQWWHPTISSSVSPFCSCPQSFPTSGSFPVSLLFTSGSQSIRSSASALVLPVVIQGWFPLALTGLISLSHYSRRIM